jgi:hypothetical protein
MKKLLAIGLLSFLVLGMFGAIGIGSASAQTATFAAGCSSALGYSVTTGLACNGTATATMPFLPGCTTALGYSITNGVPCSGGSVAIQWLAGCSSSVGYSTITGAPCNGTTVATPPVVVVVPDPGTGTTTPGLPTTGAGGNALLNSIVLVASGLFVILGGVYVAKRS